MADDRTEASQGPLGIIELLTRVGEQNVRVQSTLDSLAGVKTRKGGVTEVSFFSDSSVFAPSDAVGEPRHIGLLVWVPFAAAQQARKDHHDGR